MRGGGIFRRIQWLPSLLDDIGVAIGGRSAGETKFQDHRFLRGRRTLSTQRSESGEETKYEEHTLHRCDETEEGK